MALRFTRFANSHIGLYETQKVSTLGQSKHRDAFEHQQHRTDAIRRFEEYFEASSFLEEQPRKRFKREHEQGNPETFRLISSKLAPRPIALLPRPSETRSRSPNVQDTSGQRRLRHIQARKAAIEGEEIIMQSKFGKLEECTLKTFRTTVPIDPVVALLHQDPEPSTIKTKVPIIPFDFDSSELPRKETRRRRFKPKPPRLRPAFYRPDSTMGARATGYALGYQGSWMVDHPSKVPYERDKMKCGRLASNLHSHYNLG